MSDSWSTALGVCQLRLDIYKKDAVTFVLEARKDATRGLKEFLDGWQADWFDAFLTEFANPPYPIVYWSLAYLCLPKIPSASENIEFSPFTR